MHRLLGSRHAPPALAGAIALVYLLWQPRSTDLAAATYRAGLFSRAGFTLFDNQWYAGHHTPAYSVLFPPLGSLLGVAVVGALSVVIAAVLFRALVRSQAAALWFAIAFAVSLGSNRLPFDLGVAFALAALLAAQRDRRALAVVLAVATTFASPLAGAFLALAALLWRPGRILVVSALVPLAALTLAFPEGGREPFGASSLVQALLDTAALALLLPHRERLLRRSLGIYALACIAAFVIASPIGSNIDRLGELFTGPAAAATLWPRRRLAFGLLALPLAYWQLQSPVRDIVVASGDPSVNASYYAPLLRFLAVQSGGPFRTEIPFTEDHWEAAIVAPQFALARGWERQVDAGDNSLFYSGTLTSATYAGWLRATAIRFVALADAPLDYSAKQEAALIAAGQPYLVLVMRSAHWRVYAVADPTPLASPPATLTRLDPQGFTLAFAHADTSTVRVRFTPYWLARGGCVARAPGGWTLVRARRAGIQRVEVDFTLGRLLGHGIRCQG